jgi:tetrahydromethanopterin S-methyltransferase subunit G
VTDNVLAAIITSIATAASTAGVAITALVLNNKRFDLIEKRLDSIERRIDGFDRKLDVIQTDLKQFYKDIAQLRARTGLE